MADKLWYYARPGSPPDGPVPARELKRMAADGRLARDHLLSRTPDGRQARADTIPGLFRPAEPPAPAPPAAPAFDRFDPPEPHRTRRRSAGPGVPGGLLDFGFTRFVTPAVVRVLWAVWLFLGAPVLTLLVLAQPVLVVAGGAGAFDRPPASDARRAAEDPKDWVQGRPPPVVTNPTGPSAQAVLVSAVLAVAQLVGLALYTLVVRVVLESVVVLFRGAEAVMAINARHEANTG